MSTANTTSPLLHIENLRVQFRADATLTTAVDGVSLDILPGETVCLVGESGSGKSVTAMSILRLIQPPGQILPGSVIEFEGANVLTMDDEQLRALRGRRIGMIFQEPMTALNPVLTVGEQIAEVIRVHEGATRHDAWKRAVDMLALTGIPEPEERSRAYPHQLSGGMRQRVMIAMALVLRPTLIIADEPTTALDVTTQAQILALLHDLQHRLGSAVLFITHDFGVVAEIADRVVVMREGTVVEHAPVRELFDAPTHPYTRQLLAAMPHVHHDTSLSSTSTLPADHA